MTVPFHIALFSRTLRPTLLALAFAPLLGGASLANNGSTITAANVRFQVLTPTLMRMEYSPTAQFVDEPSVAAINRDNWPDANAASKTEGDWLVVSTPKMTVRYKTGSGAFGAENLKITWTDCGKERSWKPGDTDDKNLGGVPASLDNRSTKAVTDPGPLSRNGWYLLDDSHSALFDKASNWVKPRSEKNAQDWYFLAYGSDYKAALGELSKLLGPIPMVPRYVFGSWFGSRASYSDEQWKMIVKQFLDEELPLDVLVLDSDSRAKMVWTGYDWDQEQMPDPKAFFHWMLDRGVKVTGNEHYAPLTKESDSHFDEIRTAMGLPADTKEIANDISNKKFAGLWMDLLHKPALDWGMAFWWQDGCAGSTMDGLDPYLWTRHIEYTGSESATGKRSYAFCRLGPAWGSHRYGGYFTGDLHGQWESLPVLVPATVRGGNMLVPYMNNLCGGVFNIDLPVELYQRWVQYSSLSPIIWFHGLWGLRLPWEYGSEGVETYRKFVGLRYALIPYLYTCGRISHETGLPLARGMYLQYPDQESAYKFEQEYMLGEDLLVAPIIEPMKGKSSSRHVWLPAGDDWYDYFTGDIYRGGQIITHESPIDRMPLFVRAGAVLPMAPQMQSSDAKPVDPLTIDVYASQKASERRLYEDDGISLDYKKGAFAWTTLSFAPSGNPGDYTLTISPVEGKFKGQLKKRSYIVKIHGLLKPASISLDGKEVSDWFWDAKMRVATVHVVRPTPTNAPTLVTLRGAADFAEAVELQKAINTREQLRQAKRVMKLRHGILAGALGLKKPPRVIRATEKIEQQLTDMVDNPRSLATAKPDFEAMRKSLLAALTDQPFESNRAIPEIDPESLQTQKLIENAVFPPEDTAKITDLLRGADLPAWLHPEDRPLPTQL